MKLLGRMMFSYSDGRQHESKPCGRCGRRAVWSCSLPSNTHPHPGYYARPLPSPVPPLPTVWRQRMEEAVGLSWGPAVDKQGQFGVAGERVGWRVVMCAMPLLGLH